MRSEWTNSSRSSVWVHSMCLSSYHHRMKSLVCFSHLDTDEADGDWSLTSLHDPWAGCSILGSASPLINREDPDTAQLLNRSVG